MTEVGQDRTEETRAEQKSAWPTISSGGIGRAQIIRGLEMYDSGKPSGNELWRAKCAYAKQLKRELEFRVLLDRQDFMFALWLAFPSLQNPMAYMSMRESICSE